MGSHDHQPSPMDVEYGRGYWHGVITILLADVLMVAAFWWLIKGNR